MKNQRGFSVLEALVGVFLLGIVVTGVLPGFIAFLDANTYSEEASDAVAAAQQMMERLRLQDPTSFPTSGTTYPVGIVIGKREFEVTNTFCTEASFCGAGSRHIRTEVSYGGKSLFVVECVYTALH